MQDVDLCSLRNRMKRRGYREIHIKCFKDDEKKMCTISAIDPLSLTRVSRTIEIIYAGCLLKK